MSVIANSFPFCSTWSTCDVKCKMLGKQEIDRWTTDLLFQSDVLGLAKCATLIMISPVHFTFDRSNKCFRSVNSKSACLFIFSCEILNVNILMQCNSLSIILGHTYY